MTEHGAERDADAAKAAAATATPAEAGKAHVVTPTAEDLSKRSATRPRLLADLVDYIAEHAPRPRPGYPELDLLDSFREIWSRFDMGRQLHQSEQQIPDSAGPLNSIQLVHQALAVMRDASPDYLQHFLMYMDTLSWLEPSSGAEASGNTRASGRGKGR